jgi:GH18 family chitinase
LIRQARAYKKEKQNKRLKLWLTIGGGGREDGFKEMMKKDNQQGQVDFILKLLKLW